MRHTNAGIRPMLCILAALPACGDCGGTNQPPEDFTPLQLGMDLPFTYAAMDRDLEVTNTSGGKLRVHIGPFGTHGPAFTGHPEGDLKANWQGFWVQGRSEMTELAEDSDHDGICEPGERCGVPAADVDARTPVFIVPCEKFIVTRASTEGSAAAHGYYQVSPYMWGVEGKCGKYVWTFGHLQDLGADLKTALTLAGVDVEHPAGDHTELVADPSKGIPLAKGASLGIPQTLSDTGMTSLKDGVPYLWSTGLFFSQIEFSSRNDASGRGESFWLS